jgi:hypothetical protein
MPGNTGGKTGAFFVPIVAARLPEQHCLCGILQQLSNIQAETGCSIGVVHHLNKADSGSLTQRMRGASAIAGWAEWLIALSLHDDESAVIKAEFELKASAPPPVYFEIESASGVARLKPVDRPEAGKRAGRRPLNTIVQERERRDLQ